METLPFGGRPADDPSAKCSVGSGMPTPRAWTTLAELFEAEESALLRYAWAIVGSRAAAEDLVQEAFLRLQPLWNEVQNPRGWLYRCLRNLALNHLRDHPHAAELKEDSASDDRMPLEQMGREEALGVVRTLLAEMPDEDRVLIQFKYEQNLRYQEISKKTGLSVSNVGYRLHHVLKSLGDALRRAGIEDSRG
jgi:RNA polymerase sigma factor (sigma-70 family)